MPRHFVSRFEIRLQRRVLDIAAFCRSRRVDVDRDQRFSRLDNDGTTARQAYFAVECRLVLTFDLVAGEQRHAVFVALQLLEILRHDLLHELARGLEQSRVIDQNFGDVTAQIVAQGPDDDVTVLEYQKRGRGRGCLVDGFPKLHQVIEVPLQFLGGLAYPGGAQDQPDVFRDLHSCHRLAGFVAIRAFDLA